MYDLDTIKRLNHEATQATISDAKRIVYDYLSDRSRLAEDGKKRRLEVFDGTRWVTVMVPPVVNQPGFSTVHSCGSR